MEIGPKEAAKIRDELHNLDIGNVNDQETYYENLYYIIASGEGFSSKPYRDSRGLLTIGYGFNMDRKDDSRNEWDGVFKGLISFDDAKDGEIELTKEQARMLKRYGVANREKELAEIYAPYWNNMRLNERAILTDLYYQAPSLADSKTRLSGYMKKYYETNNPAYFDLAVTEVKLHSSHSKDPIERIGLQNRNNIRTIILDSRSCPLYSKPHDELIPENKQLEVIPGETIIPKEISDKFPKSNNLGDYYIWRTKMDGKVRPEHKDLEGRVFMREDNITHPGDDYGCRCYKQKLPIHAKIIKKEEPESERREEDFSEEIIRKHIAMESAYLRIIQ